MLRWYANLKSVLRAPCAAFGIQLPKKLMPLLQKLPNYSFFQIMHFSVNTEIKISWPLFQALKSHRPDVCTFISWRLACSYPDVCTFISWRLDVRILTSAFSCRKDILANDGSLCNKVTPSPSLPLPLPSPSSPEKVSIISPMIFPFVSPVFLFIYYASLYHSHATAVRG
jgi:hypothetical protein